MSTELARIRALAQRALPWLSGALLAALLLRALAMPDEAYDAWGYHLPFAARLWGIVPRSSFELDDHLEVLFRSYPVLAEWLEGALWVVFGRVQAANLVGLGAFVTLLAVLARRFSLPWPVGVLALLAIPLVQIHATSAYIDLPANAALTISILFAYRAFAFPLDARRSDFLLGLFAAAAAANVKYTMLPLAIPAFAVNAATYWRWNGASSRRERAAGISLALVAFSAFYLRNAVVWHDPIHPVKVALGSLSLGHGRMTTEFEGPTDLAAVPGPLRWLASVVGLRELDSARGYFNTDSTSSVVGAPSFRMGGYFGPWVIANLVVLALAIRARRDRPARAAAVTLGALTLVVALLPNSHQLRYFMCWMLTLVSLASSLIRDARVPWPAARHYTLAALAALTVVTSLTHARWLWPEHVGDAWQRFVGNTTRGVVLGRLQSGGRYCLVGQPGYVLPYAAEMRGVPSYSIKSAADASQCRGRTQVELP